MTMLLHSISIYAMPVQVTEEPASIETNQDAKREVIQLKAYDALIPGFQGIAPMTLYFIHEVVLLSEHQYQEHPLADDHKNQYLEILFPLIIGPNAP